MPLQEGYSAMNIKTDTREVLRRLMYRLSSMAGKRVTISRTIMIACEMANRHLDECETLLAESE